MLFQTLHRFFPLKKTQNVFTVIHVLSLRTEALRRGKLNLPQPQKEAQLTVSHETTLSVVLKIEIYNLRSRSPPLYNNGR